MLVVLVEVLVNWEAFGVRQARFSKYSRSGGGQGEGDYLSAYKTPNQYDSDCLFVGRLPDSSHFRTYQTLTKHMEWMYTSRTNGSSRSGYLYSKFEGT